MLEEIKEDALDVTWNDEDAKIQRIIDEGKAYLENIAGGDLDYQKPGLPKILLKNYCRYTYNNAAEHFDEFFSDELTNLEITEGADSISTLSKLLIGSISLSPNFDYKIKDYTANTTDDSNIVSAIPKHQNYNVDLKINNETFVSGDACSWREGENIVTATVSKEDIFTVNTYTVIVTKT